MRTLGFGEGRRPNRQSVRIGAKPRSTAEPIPPSPPVRTKPTDLPQMAGLECHKTSRRDENPGFDGARLVLAEMGRPKGVARDGQRPANPSLSAS
jgi:hypothetical protein